MKLTARDVTVLTGGELVSGSGDTPVESVSIDSRTLARGDLFFAVRGPHHDGHAFIDAALDRGASGVVVSETVEIAPPAFCVRVGDTTTALQELAGGVRARSEITVVAITGSMGKTTTKEAAAAAIRSVRRVLKSEGNLNNLYGLPLSLLKLRHEEVAVLEMGMSSPGEIARLTEIAKPDVGVLTNVSGVHLEFFPSVEAIAKAKGELLVGLAGDAVAVVNADDPLVLEQARKFSGTTIRFGLDETADLRALDIRASADGLRFRAEEGERSVEVRSALHGRHNVYNLLGGLAAARALDVPLDQAARALRHLKPARHRGERISLPGGILVIDETYNSSPDALICALDVLEEEPAERLVAVVGDMLELGAEAEALHRQAGREIASRRIGLLVGVGPLSRAIVDSAREAGMRDECLLQCSDAVQVGSLLAERLREGDAVLFKASRGVGLEKSVAWLCQSMEEAG